MASCEKCWLDARYIAGAFGSVSDEYHKLIEQRRETPCSPEEQCGDLHLVIKWRDGRPDQCRCGKVIE